MSLEVSNNRIITTDQVIHETLLLARGYFITLCSLRMRDPHDYYSARARRHGHEVPREFTYLVCIVSSTAETFPEERRPMNHNLIHNRTLAVDYLYDLRRFVPACVLEIPRESIMNRIQYIKKEYELVDTEINCIACLAKEKPWL